MNSRNRLELTWIGKDQHPRLEPRILIEDPAMSYHAPYRVTDHDIFDNLLIQGDNLLALKALEAEYAGKVKCIFIDPPYNTGSAFEHYEDGLEHSLWLSMMRDRLEMLRTLLADDGSIWITIDDNECHYLKVLCDEIFGRANFIASIAWQKAFAKKNKALISGSHDHLLVFAKNSSSWKRNLLPRAGNALSAYKNLDGDLRGPWQSVSYSVQSEDATKRAAYRYPIRLPSGRDVLPPPGRHWNGLPARTAEMLAANRLWFGNDGDSPPRIKSFLSEVQDGIVPDTWWPHEDAGSNQDSKKEMLDIFDAQEPFGTPKPEKLLYRVVAIASNPGDLILDSFAGSGTTGAVAHKMGRRWIMVELGGHAKTHIAARLRKVVDRTDLGGVTPVSGWTGGGGFRFMRLAPSLMQKNAFGHWVISRDYNPEMLAEAVCKHLGFKYAPKPEHWWMMGHSTERDFICVTTASLTHEELRVISEEVGTERTLLLCCKAFLTKAKDAFENLTITKIPDAILNRCEWGQDDYSLRVANLPAAPDAVIPASPVPVPKPVAMKAKSAPATPDLFGDGENA